MLTLEPNQTPYDLNFYVGDIHVRVHPMFWLMGLVIGLVSHLQGIALVFCVLIVFISVLVHELGHAITMRQYGEQARIVLYMMGGFATNGGGNIWDLGQRQRRRTPLEQIIISSMGPAAGFLLALMTVAVIHLLGGRVQFFLVQGFLPGWFIIGPGGEYFPPLAHIVMNIVLFINIYWGILNLAPVYPLDGGQITRQVCLLVNPLRGIVNSLWISLLAAVAIAVWALLPDNQQIFITFMFASMAYQSWQSLQQFSGRGGGGYGNGPW